MFERFSTYLRMIKFSHSIFALPFAGIAFVQALPETSLIVQGSVTPGFFRMLALIVVCMVALRSAAMGFNRLADREFDAKNPRTQIREIPSGKLSTGSVWIFVILSLLVFGGAAFLISTICGMLAPIAAIVVLGYSYTKRFTWLCHFFLGAAIGLSPAATSIAMTGYPSTSALFWAAGLALYIAGFDILYACQDIDFDRSIGLNSLPARFGLVPALTVARISHILALGCFTWAAYVSRTGRVFFAFLVVVASLFLVEHLLVRPGKLEKIPIAFFNVNAAISSVLLAGLLVDQWIH
ncbi:MAG: putative 4-hydroxybenzoate polyprenyltransferase [Spirochaetia bacterium]|nr:putative 4-hydroxybenzoate polyprenyltransferase [Spirochaetia bacterium]